MRTTKVILTFLIVTMFAVVSCKKFDDVKPIPGSHDNPVTTGGPTLKMGGGPKTYSNGDSLWCVPGIQNVFSINNPTPGSYYTWDFCGTVFTGSLANPQTNIVYMFPTATTCVLTVTEMPSGAVSTYTIFAANTNPLVPPLYFLGSTQNLDGTWNYQWGVRKDRISDLVGTPFQIGDHTAWVQVFTNITTTPTDSLLRFNFNAYNQMLKFNAGRGTTFSDVTGSIWAALAWPADNNYQVYLEDGVVHLATYAPTIVSPGLVGDNAGPFRMTIDVVNTSMYFQVSNFVAGLKTNPYCNYQIGTGAWSGNIATPWFNGYGWTAAPALSTPTIPNGSIVSVVYGADGGQAPMATSMFYVPSAGCLQFQVVGVSLMAPSGGQNPQILRVKQADGTYYNNANALQEYNAKKQAEASKSAANKSLNKK